MGVLDLAPRSERAHLPALTHFALKHHGTALVDDDHLERRAAPAGFAWPDETEHFVSQSAGDAPVAHGINGLLPLVLDRTAESAAVVFHFRFLFQVLGLTRKKLDLSSKRPAPEDPRRPPPRALCPLYCRIAHSYIAQLSPWQALFSML